MEEKEVTAGMILAQLLVNQTAMLEAMSELLLKHCTKRPNGQGPIDHDVIHANVRVCQALRDSKTILQRVSGTDEHL